VHGLEPLVGKLEQQTRLANTYMCPYFLKTYRGKLHVNVTSVADDNVLEQVRVRGHVCFIVVRVLKI